MSATIPLSQRMLLFSLLADKKENTRLWLRDEIDRLVEPMLESVFKRLNDKLVKPEDLDCDGVECGHVDPLENVESNNPNVQQLVTFNAQPTTSTVSSFNPDYDEHHQQQSGQVSNVTDNDTEQVYYDQQEIKEEFDDEKTISNQSHNPDISLANESTTSNEQSYLNLTYQQEVQVYQNDLQQVNPFSQFKSQQPSSLHDQQSTFFPHTHQTYSNDSESEVHQETLDQVKREIEEDEREIKLRNLQGNKTQTNEQNEDENEGEEVGTYMSGHVGDAVPQHHQVNIYNDIDTEQNFEFDEEDGNGDCETGNDVIDKFVEDYQGADDISSQCVENVRIETNQPNLVSGNSQEIINQSTQIRKLKRTHDNQLEQQRQSKENNIRVNQEDEEIETEQEKDVGDDEQLESTSRSAKRTRLSRPSTSNSNNQAQVSTIYPCLIKDCPQSFKNTKIRSQHANQSHDNTDKWPCAKCDRNFTSYKLLSKHNTTRHLLGQFNCSFQGCQFTGDTKSKMYNHARQHQPKTLKCQHFDNCNFSTLDKFQLKRHQRGHLGIKPYKCKWHQCDYAANNQDTIIRHIIRIHIEKSQDPNANQLDPKKFIEVLYELFDQVSNQSDYPDISLANASTTANEQLTVNLIYGEEGQVDLNGQQQVIPFGHVQSQEPHSINDEEEFNDKEMMDEVKSGKNEMSLHNLQCNATHTNEQIEDNVNEYDKGVIRGDMNGQVGDTVPQPHQVNIATKVLSNHPTFLIPYESTFYCQPHQPTIPIQQASSLNSQQHQPSPIPQQHQSTSLIPLTLVFNPQSNQSIYLIPQPSTSNQQPHQHTSRISQESTFNEQAHQPPFLIPQHSTFNWPIESRVEDPSFSGKQQSHFE